MDPEHGDYRVAVGSPAAGYGCQTFADVPSGSAAIAAARSAATSVPEVRRLQPSTTERPRPTGAAHRVRSAMTVSGPLSQDTTWDADTVRVVGDVLVPDGLTLSINPGVLVRFEGFFGLRVSGRLLGVGTPEARISFTSASPELFQPDTSRAGSWNGITFPGTRAGNGISRLEWCDVSCSKAVGARLEGGVFYLDAFSGLVVRNCRFTSNLAGYGGVVFAQRGSAPVFAGCVMTDNYSLWRGAAVYGADGYPRLNLCTIVYNYSLNPEPFDDTGVIHAHISKPQLYGCIVRDNFTSFFLGWELREAKPWYVRWTDIDAGGFPGEGNYDADPQFVEIDEHPLMLGPGSPCIGAGPADSLGLGLLPLDLAGLPRMTGGRLDTGAYEWSAPAAVPGESPARGAWALTASPNPFVGRTTLRFVLPHSAQVRVTAWDAAGRRLGVLRAGVFPAGCQTVTWGPDVAGSIEGPADRPARGLYFIRLEVDGVARASLKLVPLH